MRPPASPNQVVKPAIIALRLAACHVLKKRDVSTRRPARAKCLLCYRTSTEYWVLTVLYVKPAGKLGAALRSPAVDHASDGPLVAIAIGTSRGRRVAADIKPYQARLSSPYIEHQQSTDF